MAVFISEQAEKSTLSISIQATTTPITPVFYILQLLAVSKPLMKCGLLKPMYTDWISRLATAHYMQYLIRVTAI